MLYLSKGEQAALIGLLVLLLTGTGLLCYRQGERAAQRQKARPRFVEAQGTAVPLQTPAPAARTQAMAPTAAPMAPIEEKAPTVVAPAPPKAAAPAGATTAPKGKKDPGQVSLNRATQAQLEALPGIGPVSAQRIIARRAQLVRENGHGFASLDQLLDVPGIGPKRFAVLRSHLRLD
jgi:competence protein ComEA